MSTHSARIAFVVQSLRGVMPKDFDELAIATGVPKDTIRKIRSREVKDPRSSTLDALHEYFERALSENKGRRKEDMQQPNSST